MKKEFVSIFAVLLILVLLGATVVPTLAKGNNPSDTSFDSALNKKTFNSAENYGGQISTVTYTKNGSIKCMRFKPGTRL